MINEIQKKQDNEYWFPYHYVSQMPFSGFKQHFIDTWGICYISTIEYVLDTINNEKGASSIVDIGCGDGRLTKEIKRAYPEAAVLGVDYSDKAISLARAMNYELPDETFLAQDITHRPLEKKFDVAILMEVFEHIPINGTDAFLKGVKSCLEPNGVLLLTVPHKNKPLEHKHFQHFSLETLKEQLDRHFDVIEMVPFEKKGILRYAMNIFLCNRLFILNNEKLLSKIYNIYKKHLFHCKTERECQRIFVRAKLKA